MMDAKKANKLTYQAKERLLQESFDKVESRIIESINKGNFDTIVNILDISHWHTIKEVLISKGFVVQQTDGVFWIIKWDDVSTAEIEFCENPKPARVKYVEDFEFDF